MSAFRISLASIFFGLISCNNKNLNTEITSIKEISQIPSASGIEIIDNQNFIIGDNSPWLFKLNDDLKIVDRISLHEEFSQKFDIIPKPIKPDYEALTSFKEDGIRKLMIFGSGSLREVRDHLLIIDPNNQELKQYSLTGLYQSLIKTANIETADLNIEAAVASDKHLYLFNRGKNISFKCSLTDFLHYIKTQKQIPGFELTTYNLPELDGIEAGFSGACINQEQTKIFFTASVENTKNWIADGEVTGSFIGYIDLGTSVIKTKQLISGNKPLLSKVESLAIKKEFNNNYEFLLVTDNDGKASQMITLNLSL